MPRSPLFWIHVIAGVLLAVLVYSPLGDEDAGEILLKAVAVPALFITGLLTWLGHRPRHAPREPGAPPPA